MSMTSQIKKKFTSFFQGHYYDRLRVAILALAFFTVIGAYTLVKELKDSVFVNVVGLEYMPKAKLLSLVVLIPLVFFYGRLVDLLRRYQLLYVYALIYGLGGLALAFFMGHPTIGLLNTDTSPYRLYGWIFYFFMEGYSPFVVSVLWAFTNSVTGPGEVKNNYITLTASSKLGGALMAGFAWWFLSLHEVGNVCVSDVARHQLLLVFASALLLTVPFMVMLLMKYVPGRFLHGYEAAYKAEKKKAKEEDDIQDSDSSSRARTEKSSFSQKIESLMGKGSKIFSGLILFFKYPYVAGVFGMIFFWEIVNVIFNFLRLGIGVSETKSAAEFGAFLYKQACLTHTIGFVFVLVGTKMIISWFGERRSLIAIPVLTGITILTYLMFQTAFAATIAYITVRVINYALAYPLRESLYIPTTKDVKFKAKSWIDGVGSKVSKGVGSIYNEMVIGLAPSVLFNLNVVFFGLVIGLWALMANLLGRRFEKAVKKNEVIGVDE